MYADQTILHTSEPDCISKFLDYSPIEHPVVAQIGGNDPESITAAAVICEKAGYDQVNLNCGCPSPKVAGKGCFGARLMLDPHHVAAIVAAAKQSLTIPFTVKCRIGVDEQDSYKDLHHFISTLSNVGVDHFLINARKALLNGISPAQNRSVPPLKYEYVYKLVQDFPNINISINGGITTFDEVDAHLQNGIYSAMIGRQACNSPWMFSDADRRFFGSPNVGLSRREVLERYSDYAEDYINSSSLSSSILKIKMLKPVNNLFHCERNGNVYRQTLEKLSRRNETTVSDCIMGAMTTMSDDALDAKPPLMDDK